MSERPPTPDEDAGQADPTITFALRAMVPPEHGDGFWDRLDASLGAEAVAPTTAVPLAGAAAPPPPPLPPPAPMAEVVPLPAPRRSWPAPWIAAAAAAVLVVAVAAGAAVRSGTTDVETTTAATAAPVETTTPAPPPTVPVPTTAAATMAPPTSARPAPTSTTAAPRSTTTAAKPTSLTLSPAGLGPLRLGMTTKQAEATGAVGPFEDPLDTGGACGHAVPAGTYRASDFGGLFLEGRLARVYVSEGSRLRSPQGIGVGSFQSKLSAVPGTRVESPHPYGGGTNVDITTGDVGYQFTVDKGVVTEWSVGTKEALALPEGCA